MENKVRTVYLEEDKCIGCITCLRRCPTEAIRIIRGKARIDYSKCINCGECVRSCPKHAKRPLHDSLSDINKYKYKIALPSPSLMGQFKKLKDVNFVLNGLINMGFDKVFEVAVAAELVSDATRKLMKEGNLIRPVLSSACPAIVELILIRFQNLRQNLLPLLSPAAVAAKLAREEAISETGLKSEEIGVFFISPCPSKVYALKSAEIFGEVNIDGVLSQSEVYFKLVSEMNKIEKPIEMSRSSMDGISWGQSGGESSLLNGKFIHADGITNILSVLKEVEDEKLGDVDFIELNMCPGGCVGGVFNIENPFVARSKITYLKSKMKKHVNNMETAGKDLDFFKLDFTPPTLDVLKLDEDRFKAMQKMMSVEELLKTLPQTDCGECGAPTCRCYAEDIVMGREIGECKKRTL